MKVGIDARLYGLEHAGIGRYVMNLVDRLVQDPTYDWVIFVSPHYVARFSHLPNVHCVESTIRHYSVKEQTHFLNQLNQEKLDVLHVPHFNVPILYNRPFVVTIHDILWHQVRGGSVTTLSPIMYYIKYVGYLLTVKHAVTAALKVCVPSHYVKKEIQRTFPKINPEKIIVTYEGIDFHDDVSIKSVTGSSSNSLLYIGSAYPHKNLTTLLQALAILRATTHPDMKLVFVGSRSVFLDEVQREVDQRGLSSAVTFSGYQTDSAVREMMRRSLCLVHPSKSEGFGLTGLEAMASGTPVIAANATALPEVYGDAALYFNPDSASDLATKIRHVASVSSVRKQLIEKGYKQITKFSWDSMVNQTKAVYKSI